METRFFDTTVELRAGDGDGETGERILEGYAAVFGTPSDIGGMFTETIRKGAFSKTIKETDQVMLWNHDDGKPLGRRSKGTLRLSEDGHGLKASVTLADTSWGNDAHISVKRGDVQGMSFRFAAVQEKWDESDLNNIKRDILEARVPEVSPVTFPAFPQTEIEARAIMDDKGIGKRDESTEEPVQDDHSDAGLEEVRRMLLECDLTEAEV